MDVTPQSVILGFTPINSTTRRPSSHCIDRMETASGTLILQSESSSHAAGQKRKRNQASGLAVDPKSVVERSKPKALPVPRRARVPTNKKVSQGLKVSRQISPAVTKPSLDGCSTNSNEKAVNKTKSRQAGSALSMPETLPSLRGKYQAACSATINKSRVRDSSELHLSSQNSTPSYLLASHRTDTAVAIDGWISPITVLRKEHGPSDAECTHDTLDIEQDGLILHCESSNSLLQSPQMSEADFAASYRLSTESTLPLVLRPEELCSSSIIDNGSDLQQTNTSFVLYEDPEILMPTDSAMVGFQAVRGQLLQNSHDDDFPMEDESMEEILKLTEIKQGKDILNSSLAFQGHSIDAYLIDDLNIEDIGWLDEFPNSNMHNLYKDGTALPRVAMNRSDAISLPSSAFESADSTCLYGMNDSMPDKTIDSDASNPDETSFNDDDLDLELLKLTAPRCDSASNLYEPVETVTPDTEKTQTSAAFIHKPEKSSAFISPANVPHMISFDADRNPIPFLRPPFPKMARDRSPILGLGTHMVLRTCFRIGEALNAASVASRANIDTIIELYARVISSEREPGSFKQTFHFSDLFTAEKSPCLGGTYALWKGVKLWDQDAKVFLGNEGRGKMARTMGRIKREPVSNKWEMAILSVWQVDWADVGIAKGILLS